MEPQTMMNDQTNPDKEQSWRHHSFLFQNILQNHSKQNIIVVS